jgi:hypothetical protein
MDVVRELNLDVHYNLVQIKVGNEKVLECIFERRKDDARFLCFSCKCGFTRKQALRGEHGAIKSL